ncbi:MAG: M28 family peptidase [Bacteroidales bacterium]|nr:M28 family peptidase [Bacteroidales bacterium]
MKIIQCIIILLLFPIWSCKSTSINKNKAELSRIKTDLMAITSTEQYRNYRNIESLNEVANYILNVMKSVCDTAYYQCYVVGNREYKNVIGRVDGITKDKIILGAHYDVAGDQEGADDNASGVAGLLELTRMLSGTKPNCTIELVAYTLEEPPFFQTKQMGSYVHAKSVYDNNENIKGMICMDMIGYFNTNENSQEYPLNFLKLFYGNKGDFITVVQRLNGGKFSNRVNRLMKKQTYIKSKAFKGPQNLAGVDFSDHANYWKFGYSAVLITNSAFYRNHNYHTSGDTIETLDLKRMCGVIEAIYHSIIKL